MYQEVWSATFHQLSGKQKRQQRKMSSFDIGSKGFVCLLVACLTSQQHASVSQGRIYLDNCKCCHTKTEVADQTFFLIQSQYTDTEPTSPSADPKQNGFLS